MFKRRFCSLVFLLLALPAAFGDEYIDNYIPEAQAVGKGRLKVLLWSVYDATLYSPHGKWRAQPPYALKLTYLRDFNAKDIADRSVEEIRDLGYSDEVKLADWHAQLLKILPDIKKHSSLTGVVTDKGQTLFYIGEQQIGKIKDKTFARQFFNIWLSEETKEPRLREQLLGLK